MPAVSEPLPPPDHQWVAEQAAATGLPDPDNSILLLVLPAKQRQDSEPAGRREIAGDRVGLSPHSTS